MDVGTIDLVIAEVANQIVGIVGALIPVGSAMTLSLTALAVIFLGVALAQGAQLLIGPLLRVTAAATLTHWAVIRWDELVLGMLLSSREVIGLLIPGYAGPTHLIQMAFTAAGRIEVEQLSFSIGGIKAFVEGALMAMIAPAFVFIGLSAMGLLAILAEILLLLGASIGPLILPFLAFRATADLGWGPLRFLVQASIRVIMIGVINHLFARAIANVVILPLGDNWLRHEDMYALMGLSLLCMMVAWAVNGIARDSIGGGPASMGMGSVTQTGGQLAAMGAGAAGALSAVGIPRAAMAGASMAARGAARGAVAAAGGAVGMVERSTQSAFR